MPEISSSNFMQRSFGERIAMNAPIQGTAADIIKIAMNRVHRRLIDEGLKSRLLLQVHDELLIEAAPDEVDEVKKILDEEMKYRVLLHKERRPSDWKTYEIMHTAGNQIGTVLNETDTILFDCITMYVSNLLMDHISNIDAEVLGVSDLEKLQSLLQNDLDRMFNEISLVSDREIIFVSDELGMGIVPANAMGRVYRDLVGLANQYIAKKADEVYLSIAGITVELKSRGVELS
mgnify:FL=1